VQRVILLALMGCTTTWARELAINKVASCRAEQAEGLNLVQKRVRASNTAEPAFEALAEESQQVREAQSSLEERGDSGDGISTPAEGSSLDDLLEWDATSAMQTASNLAEGEESSSSSEDETLASNSASFPSSELFMTENEEDASEEDSDSPSTSLTKLLTQEKYSGVGDVQNHLQELNRQITSKQRATSERLAQHRQKYGHALKEMLLSNRQVALTNKQVIAQIQDVQHSNLALRSAASRLVSQSHMLRKDLEALKANISIAGEFAKRALTSPALLDESWEMQVLRAMDESKKLETLGHEHDQMRLPQVHDVAMLFLDGAPLATSEDMLKMLAADVAYLDKKTADSEAQLAAKFREKTASLKHAHEELVAEQSRLKAQYSKVKDMNSKLQSAVQHLNTAKEELEQHTEALRRFTSQMGKPKATAASVHAAKPQVMATGRHKGIALLQSNDSGDSEESGKGIDTGAVGGSSLPEVNHLKASKEFKAVQANIESLQAKFATMSRQHVADIAKARAKYEKQLSSEHHKLIVLKKENTALARKIEAARGRNVDLRAQAKRFNVKNQVLVSQLQGIRANLSTADEWVQLSLDKSKAMMEEPEMEVLSQLDHEDAKAQAKEAHELRLNSIGSALLQEDDLVLEQPALEQDDHSANVFDKLDKAIAKMREEQRSNAESLQRAFEEQHSENLGRGKKLLAEQKNLKHKLSSEEALEQRLTAALKRLSEGHNTLRHQLHSVKHFSQMLSESGTQGG